MQEYFSHKESAEIVSVIDDVARRHSGRELVFDDWLTMIVCCLAGGTREDEYLQTVQPYCAGEKGKRDIDALATLLGRLVNVMEETRADILGDIFQGAITRGQNGQYFTPDPICDLMAKLVAADGARGPGDREHSSENPPVVEATSIKTVSDPCCGSGRMLLAAAKEDRNRYFVGQDVDHRCCKIAAINLAMWNLTGKVIWGNSLTLESNRVYHTGFDGKGVIRVEERSPVKEMPEPKVPGAQDRSIGQESYLRQGSLFDDDQI